MKDRLKRLTKMLVAVALCAAGAAPLFSQPSNQFGMIGLSFNQTLRLSVVAAGGPCSARLSFANSADAPVGPNKTVILLTGQADFLDLPGSALFPRNFDFDGGASDRIEILPVAAPAGGTTNCQATAELFDSFSGYSLVLAPGLIAYPPGPAFGLLGVATSQTLRLNVVALPPNMCMAQLSFVDKSDKAAGPAPKSVTLTAGQAAFLDIPGGNRNQFFGPRSEFRPVVTVTGGGMCAATAELYDFGGRTWSWIFPDAGLSSNFVPQ